MKLLVVEDEALLAKRLVHLIGMLLPEATIAGCTKSIAATVQWLLQNGDPDLIFMDIELADGQCFEIFQQCKPKSPIIFTTAYDEYALRAFKLNSVDYLLKPIKQEELAEALRKWKETRFGNMEQGSVKKIEALLKEFRASPASFRSRFLVRQGKKLVPIETEEVGYFSSKNSLSFLVTKQKQKFYLDYTLDEIEGMLDPTRFLRVNRQFIVAQEIVKAVQAWFNGKLKLEVQAHTDEDIIVSREKAAIVKEWLGA
jgi:two-component system, LytTR family, response regulator LytT